MQNVSLVKVQLIFKYKFKKRFNTVIFMSFNYRYNINNIFIVIILA